MSFKIGDRVHISDDLRVGGNFKSFVFPRMEQYAGKDTDVIGVIGKNDYKLAVDEGGYYYSDDMLSLTPRFKVGDTVTLRKDLKESSSYSVYCTPQMAKLAGKELKVACVDVKEFAIYHLEGVGPYCFTEDMFLTPKFFVGEIVRVKKNLKDCDCGCAGYVPYIKKYEGMITPITGITDNGNFELAIDNFFVYSEGMIEKATEEENENDTTGLSFSQVLEGLKAEKWQLCSREGWAKEWRISVDKSPIDLNGSILVKINTNKCGDTFVIPYTPDVMDLFAEDWYIVE